MDTDMDETFKGIAAALIAVFAFTFGWVVGHDCLKKEAVKKHHAEYYLDANNEKQWRWKEDAQ